MLSNVPDTKEEFTNSLYTIKTFQNSYNDTKKNRKRIFTDGECNTVIAKKCRNKPDDTTVKKCHILENLILFMDKEQKEKNTTPNVNALLYFVNQQCSSQKNLFAQENLELELEILDKKLNKELDEDTDKLMNKCNTETSDKQCITDELMNEHNTEIFKTNIDSIKLDHCYDEHAASCPINKNNTKTLMTYVYSIKICNCYDEQITV